ncbi:aldo/keto reductase [Reyranella sp.]|uniref:aldo/keto reductase n=1 Tax=Reyranella sp. TaxID=1929291 RepID=UPI003D13E47B
MTMATMAMRWVISNTAITAPIICASKPEQLADGSAAAEQGALPKDLKARLDEITREWQAVDAER